MGSSAAVGEDPWDMKDSGVEGRYDGGGVPLVEGRKGGNRVRFGGQGQGYQHPAEQTGYDPAAYR